MTGTVQAASGAPIAGADVTAAGPQRLHVVSDASGHFTMSLGAGIYRLDVNKGGFLPTTIDTLAITKGSTQTVTVVLTHADLSSLRTIGRVSVSARSSFNSSVVSSNFVDADMLRNTGSPQIVNLVQTIPGAAIQRGSSNPNIEISLAGSQPYETQTLIDGHPIATGRVGAFYAQFLDQDMISGIETQLGPGNTTPFAGTAVGGTANLLTPGFTTKSEFHASQAIDSTGSVSTNVIASGSFGKFAYVAGAGVDGYNGPFADKQGCVLSPLTKSSWNTAASTGVISFCAPLGSALMTKGQVAKLRYNFSPTTSLEAGFIGTQSGYYPQNSTYGVDGGAVPIQNCVTVPGTALQQCTSPYQSGYVGQTITGYFYYPGSFVNYMIPLFEGQLRTAIGGTTLLVRPYAGAITRNIDGAGEAGYPAFWFPASEGTAPGTAGYNYCAKQESPGYPTTASPTVYNPIGVTVNGLTECVQSPYSTYEHDTLHGTTISAIRPLGQNSLTFTYDYHSDQSYSASGAPFNLHPQVPAGTIARYNTFSVSGDFALRDNLNLRVGLYDSSWALNGTTTVSQTSNGSGGVTVVSGPLSVSVTRFDPHIALAWQPRGDTSYRFAYGTSTTFPYALLVSGTTSVTNPSGTGSAYPSLTQKNPYLAPERATEFDLGLDHRFKNGGVLTVDLLNNNITNVFETLSVLTPTPGGTFPFETVTQPINAANLASKVGIIGYRYQPRLGLGYYANATFTRSVVNGIPLSYYGTNPNIFSIPANGVQQCSDGANTVCIPYAKAYANVNYRFRGGAYMGLGLDLEGKNNTYFQPPFGVFDFVARAPMTKNLEAQMSVYNLLNTNAFGNLPRTNAGTPIIGENGLGQYGNYASASLPYPLIPVQQRTLYFTLRYHGGKL